MHYMNLAQLNTCQIKTGQINFVNELIKLLEIYDFTCIPRIP